MLGRKRAKATRQNEVQALYKKCAPLIDHYLQAKLGLQAADREELIQEAFIAWIQNEKAIANPCAWLRKVAENKHNSRWRKRSSHEETGHQEAIIEQALAAQNQSDCQESPCTRQEQDECLQREVLARLSPLCAEVLGLVVRLGLRASEIATWQQARPETVRNRLSDCRRKAETLFARYCEELSGSGTNE